ncbi:MAG: heme o synthase [Bacteroidia bacterium]|nr:heme o synthase [Bacteroidia bacterium]
MLTKDKIQVSSKGSLIKEKLGAYVELLKFKLSLLVAVSGIFGYAMAAGTNSTWLGGFVVGLGALLVTGASNTLNQVMEIEYDKLMKRTENRPLPTGKLNSIEATVYAILIGSLGIVLMGLYFNLAAALLSVIALLSYAFVYTPMKRISPIAVFIGAIPGALPPLIGWVAVTGELGIGGIILFIFQFFWQFPHFWAIAWLAEEDYKKAGFKMMPSSAGKTPFSAFLIFIYAFSLVPLTWFAWQTELVGLWGAIGLVIAGILFSVPAWMLYRTMEKKFARQVMFASFAYLPLIQLVFLFG